MTLTLLDLARDQTSQNKLRHEIATLGDGELDFDTVQKLEYLDAVIKEGYVNLPIVESRDCEYFDDSPSRLRLHPAAPRTDRVALKDDVIPLSMPVHTTDGRIINAIPVKAGQVFLSFRLFPQSPGTDLDSARLSRFSRSPSRPSM